MKKKKIKEILIGSLFFIFFYPSPSCNSCLTSTTEAWFWRDWMNLNLMMLETGKRLWARMASQKTKELNYRFNFSQFLNEKLYLQASVRPRWKKVIWEKNTLMKVRQTWIICSLVESKLPKTSLLMHAFYAKLYFNWNLAHQ